VELVERFFSRLDCELDNGYGRPKPRLRDVLAVQARRKAMEGADWTTDREHKHLRLGRPLRAWCQSASPASFTSAARVLARGYLNAPELTAERFIADPFTAQSARDSTGRAMSLVTCQTAISNSSVASTTRSRFAAFVWSRRDRGSAAAACRSARSVVVARDHSLVRLGAHRLRRRHGHRGGLGAVGAGASCLRRKSSFPTTWFPGRS
jgi:hypothetical protein